MVAMLPTKADTMSRVGAESAKLTVNCLSELAFWPVLLLPLVHAVNSELRPPPTDRASPPIPARTSRSRRDRNRSSSDVVVPMAELRLMSWPARRVGH